MIHFNDLYLGNISGGQMDGYCAAHLELGVEKDSSVTNIIRSILAFGRTQIFKIYGDFKHTPGEELFTLLSVLRENKYVTMAVLDGQKKEEWMDQITYRVLEITEEPWLMIAGSEIHYKPLVTEEIEVPQLREIHAGAMCYLDIRRDMHPTVVFDFLKKFPLWRLFSPASKSYRMAIPLLE